MKGRSEEGVVNTVVMMESINERGERILGNRSHFVFATIDCANSSIGFVVIHGVADREAAHQIANSGLVGADIFPQHKVKVVGKEEKAVQGYGGSTQLRAIAFGDYRLGS